MKAYLLAAGLGTRLRPLTNIIPKCLIDIAGKPLMQWWLELFERYSVSEVLVNTHYLAEQVHAFIESYNTGNEILHFTKLNCWEAGELLRLQKVLLQMMKIF